MKKVINSIVILAILMVFSSCQKKSGEKQIVEFRLASYNVAAMINEDLGSITATLPYGTDVTALTPIIVVSDKATVSPESGKTMDFTNPVTYTVTAEDGSQAVYVAVIKTEKAEQVFLGSWGIEKLEYFTVDNQGNQEDVFTYLYDPNSTNDGIQLYFREDNTGEMRDSSIEELWLDWNDETEDYDTHIICPDTILVKPFTYTYDESGNALYMTMNSDSNVHTYKLIISDLSNEAFVYENVYAQYSDGLSYVEKAYLKRVGMAAMKSSGNWSFLRPHKMHGSLLSDR